MSKLPLGQVKWELRMDLGFSSMEVTGAFDKVNVQCRGDDKTLNGVYSVKGRLLIVLLLHMNNKEPRIA